MPYLGGGPIQKRNSSNLWNIPHSLTEFELDDFNRVYSKIISTRAQHGQISPETLSMPSPKFQHYCYTSEPALCSGDLWLLRPRPWWMGRLTSKIFLPWVYQVQFHSSPPPLPMVWACIEDCVERWTDRHTSRRKLLNYAHQKDIEICAAKNESDGRFWIFLLRFGRSIQQSSTSWCELLALHDW